MSFRPSRHFLGLRAIARERKAKIDAIHAQAIPMQKAVNLGLVSVSRTRRPHTYDAVMDLKKDFEEIKASRSPRYVRHARFLEVWALPVPVPQSKAQREQ